MKQIPPKIASILLMLSVLMLLLPATAFAAEGSGTGSDPYLVNTWDGLRQYMESGGHIRLTGDINRRGGQGLLKGDTVVISGKDVVLDLSGYDIQVDQFDGVYLISVKNNANLTINGEGGSVTFKNCTSAYEPIGNNREALFWVEDTSSLTINGGEYNCAPSLAFTVLGDAAPSRPSVVINGGSFNQYGYESKDFLFGRNMAINGGNFDAGISMSFSEINGGVFDPTSGWMKLELSASKINGGFFYCDAYMDVYDNDSFPASGINGGTFYGNIVANRKYREKNYIKSLFARGITLLLEYGDGTNEEIVPDQLNLYNPYGGDWRSTRNGTSSRYTSFSSDKNSASMQILSAETFVDEISIAYAAIDGEEMQLSSRGKSSAELSVGQHTLDVRASELPTRLLEQGYTMKMFWQIDGAPKTWFDDPYDASLPFDLKAGRHQIFVSTVLYNKDGAVRGQNWQTFYLTITKSDMQLNEVLLYVDEPQAGKMPNYYATSGATNYEYAGAVVQWLPQDRVFQPGVAYTAVVTTVIDEFDGVFGMDTDFYINGNPAQVVSGTESQAQVEYTFASLPAEGIKEVEINGITPPVAGAEAPCPTSTKRTPWKQVHITWLLSTGNPMTAPLRQIPSIPPLLPLKQWRATGSIQPAPHL